MGGTLQHGWLWPPVAGMADMLGDLGAEAEADADVSLEASSRPVALALGGVSAAGKLDSS